MVFHDKATKNDVDELIGINMDSKSDDRTFRKMRDDKSVKLFINSIRLRFTKLHSTEHYSDEFNTEFDNIIVSLESLLLKEVGQQGDND